ncbi:hypothetical protein [Micromonospora sp. NPDC049645]|uniref:hypothetical protein n=1 Tax=Micromonospora sp. NPDC049645 TaxID=3155508 RepID=UPI00341A4481
MPIAVDADPTIEGATWRDPRRPLWPLALLVPTLPSSVSRSGLPAQFAARRSAARCGPATRWRWPARPVCTAGLVATVGVVDGMAINTAHELGHKRERVERWLSRVALAPTGYGHLYVEHNRGHHERVAARDDPASSRSGESFWAFWPRTVFGSLRSAWRLETSRFRIRGRSPWAHRNDVLNAWAVTLVLYAALTVAPGPGVLPRGSIGP